MNYSALDDLQLLELLQEDFEGAFAEIYNRYWRLLYNTANNIIRNEAIAQDAVQEVFIALWQRRKETEIQFINAYLQQAVRFQVFKMIRSQQMDDAFYNRLASVTADIVYENPLLFKEQEYLLREISEALPEDCRVVFRLSREERLTYKQIANQLNISEKTVEKKMSICLKHMRQALKQYLGISLLLLIAKYVQG